MINYRIEWQYHTSDCSFLQYYPILNADRTANNGLLRCPPASLCLHDQVPAAAAKQPTLTRINPLAKHMFLCSPLPVLRHRTVTLSAAFPDGAVG